MDCGSVDARLAKDNSSEFTVPQSPLSAPNEPDDKTRTSVQYAQLCASINPCESSQEIVKQEHQPKDDDTEEGEPVVEGMPFHACPLCKLLFQGESELENHNCTTRNLVGFEPNVNTC